MDSSLVVGDLLFHSINERHFVFLIHSISTREAFVCGCIGGIHKMMYLVEGTVIQLIDFVKPIHNLLDIGLIFVCLVLWHFNVAR